MVTSAISRHVAASIPQLVLGSNLFTEFGRASQCVVINLTVQNGDANIVELRYAAVNIVLKGYDVKEGMALANRIIKSVLTLEGTELNNPLNAAEKYRFHAVTARMWPTPFNTPDGQQISANIDINFKELGG